MLETGHIKTNSKRAHGYRLRQIQKMLTDLQRSHVYQAVIMERGFSRFPKTTQALFKVVGLSNLVFDNIVEISPMTIKKAVTGSGKASKGQVEKAVRRIMKIPGWKFATDDESDATAVCLTYLIREDLIQKGLID